MLKLNRILVKRLGAILSILMLFVHQVPVKCQDFVRYEYQHINSKKGNFSAKLKKEDHFGYGIASMGDLNGDGVADLVVGASGDDTGGMNTGAVYLLYLKADGSVLKYEKFDKSAAGLEGIQSGGQFGAALGTLEDMDANGIPEILVGEPGFGKGIGRIWILFLNEYGFLQQVRKIEPTSSALQGLVNANDKFGFSICGLTDMDGDGLKEIAVGSGLQSENKRGKVWLLNINEDASISNARLLIHGKEGDNFGYALCAPGDINDDGLADLAVGAPGDDDGGIDNGALYVIFGSKDAQHPRRQKISDLSGNFVGKLDNTDRMGNALAAGGDRNNDGIPDLVVGTWQDDDGGIDKGAIRIIYLNEDGSWKSGHKVSETTGNLKAYFPTRYSWGKAICTIGAVNDDMPTEIAVSGHLDSEGGFEKGALWILFPQQTQGAKASENKDVSILDEPLTEFQETQLIQRHSQFYTEDSGEEEMSLDQSPPSHLVLLLDVSASMKKPEKLPLLRDAFLNILAIMRPADLISIITYSGEPKVALAALSAAQADSISYTIQALNSKGDTKTGKALKKAYELANQTFIHQGNNRIILATDGGFEIKDLYKLTDKYATEKLPLSVFYFGKLPLYKKRELDLLARKGYGNCSYISGENGIQALLRELQDY